jgi:signal peptidase I
MSGSALGGCLERPTVRAAGLLAGCSLTAMGVGVLLIRRRYIVVNVIGASMQPTYHEGDRVLVRRGRSGLRAGSVVVLRPPATTRPILPPHPFRQGTTDIQGAAAARRSATASQVVTGEAHWAGAGQGASAGDLRRVGAREVHLAKDGEARPGGLAWAAGPGWMIKRVVALAGDPVPEAVQEAVGGVTIVPAGALVVLADNPSGIDSRRFGFAVQRDVLGPVVARLPSRAGRR